MLKWKLMVSTLPVVLVLLGLKLVLEHVFGFEGLIDFSDVGIILTSGVFLIGFLLAGTMADYKEAEKLPGRPVLHPRGHRGNLRARCHGPPDPGPGEPAA